MLTKTDLQALYQKHMGKYNTDVQSKGVPVLTKWREYRDKIINGTLTLEEYTNRKPIDYLCNFAENESEFFGSSRAGYATHFMVKLNDDGITYYLSEANGFATNKTANRQDAEAYFNSFIKPLLYNIVTCNDYNDLLTVANSGNFQKYHSKVTLGKIVLLESLVRDNVDFFATFLMMFEPNAINFLCSELGLNTANNRTQKSYEIMSKCYNELSAEIPSKSIETSYEIYQMLLEHCKKNGYFVKKSNGSSFQDQEQIEEEEAIYESNSADSLQNNNSTCEGNLWSDLKKYLFSNTIFYGVPGCGKSYHIKNLLKYADGREICKDYYKRILFHPEYTYSDFIGQIMPETVGTKIEYKFKAGPFTKILKSAIEDTDNNYFLVIEEINRGNAPAIFGDIFQLLDRDNGESEYDIDNESILDEINKDKDGNEKPDSEKIDKIKIPKNLTILATMNTSDQNVFTLDTAFKRRWRMVRISNDFSVDTALSNKPINKINISWRVFAEALNDGILKCDGMIAEDKLLGSHFVKSNDLDDIRKFAEKVFMYLWTDVVKYNKEQLFDSKYKTLDKVIEDFCRGENVFNDACTELAKLYVQVNTSNQNSTVVQQTESEQIPTTEQKEGIINQEANENE